MNTLIFCKVQNAKQELCHYSSKHLYNADKFQLCRLIYLGEHVTLVKLPEVSKLLDSSSKSINEIMHVKCSAPGICLTFNGIIHHKDNDNTKVFIPFCKWGNWVLRLLELNSTKSRGRNQRIINNFILKWLPYLKQEKKQEDPFILQVFFINKFFCIFRAGMQTETIIYLPTSYMICVINSKLRLVEIWGSFYLEMKWPQETRDTY